MDESQKVAHCSKKSMQISLNKIRILQKGTKSFTENQISAVSFLMKWVGMQGSAWFGIPYLKTTQTPKLYYTHDWSLISLSR